MTFLRRWHKNSVCKPLSNTLYVIVNFLFLRLEFVYVEKHKKNTENLILETFSPVGNYLTAS